MPPAKKTNAMALLPVALFLLLSVDGALADSTCAMPLGVDPVTGLRMARYRAPVPECLPAGETLTPAAVSARLAQEALSFAADDPLRTLLIDVYPPRGAGPDPLDGAWRLAEQRLNIAGSIWLPEVGRGYLDDAQQSYFRDNLLRLTQGDSDRPLLFYCTADCWQGWNAARRAISWGYRRVAWYPLGSDGWRELGLPLVAASPIPFFVQED